MNDPRATSKSVHATFANLCGLFLDAADSMDVGSEVVGRKICLTVTPHGADISKLIGSRGVMFDSMRSILTAVARRDGCELHYKVCEPVVGQRGDEPAFKGKANWMSTVIMATFRQTCASIFERPFQSEWRHNGDKSNIVLLIDGDEAKRVADAELSDGLSRVFNAIGNANGRRIYVEMTRRKGRTNEQPREPAAA